MTEFYNTRSPNRACRDREIGQSVSGLCLLLLLGKLPGRTIWHSHGPVPTILLLQEVLWLVPCGPYWSLSLCLCSSCHLPMRLGPTGLSPTSTLLSPISLLVQLEDPSRKSFGSPLPPAPSLPLGPCWCLQYGGVHAFPCVLQTGDSSRWS